ncbi:zinc metalloproteinase nas-4-like [Homarus americanus]|uniref:zinc metalloproteinase nas-4-like n=1 Tax=Homarus americanus TaxID=6706 RepID=UPI001C47F143|nr:zinc metalloproteinase nas-4-like [Homarus americanus]
MAYVNLRKGYQVVNLQRGCLVVTGTPMHEFLHAAGIFHQQCRIDRDDYIFVQLKNTVSSYAHNFKIFRSKFPLLWLQGLPYDYHSVMHYGKKAFSSNDQNVIEVKKKDFAGSLGQRPTLSRSDIANLNRMYECWDHYLGDDIPGAIPYKEYHARFVKPDSTKVPSPSFQKWIDHIKSKT